MSLVPPEHQRIIPHMEISEQGLRELEIWLLNRLTVKCALLLNVANGIPPRCHGWLYVETDTSGGPSLKGIALKSGTNFLLQSATNFDLFCSRNLNIVSQGEFNLTSNSSLNAMLLTALGGITLTDLDVDDTINVLMGGNVGGVGSSLNLIEANGGNINDSVVLRMFDSVSNNRYVSIKKADDTVLFRVANDSTTTHNLDNGKTLVINDHLSNPIVTYTG